MLWTCSAWLELYLHPGMLRIWRWRLGGTVTGELWTEFCCSCLGSFGLSPPCKVKQRKHPSHTSLETVLWKIKEIFAFSANADAKQMLFLFQGLLRYKAEESMISAAGEAYYSFPASKFHRSLKLLFHYQTSFLVSKSNIFRRMTQKRLLRTQHPGSWYTVH